MNRKMLLIIAVEVAAVLSWPMVDSSMSVYAQAAPVVTVQKENVTETYFDSCNNEPIDLSYVWHQVNSVTPNADGGVHIGWQSNLSRFVGVGQTTGTTYRGQQTINNYVGAADTSYNPPFELAYFLTATLQSQGSVPNVILKIRFHLTINANGETTSAIDRGIVTCK